MDIEEFTKRVNRTATEHGWWETPEDRNVPTKLALIHSEISEALEEFRHARLGVYYSGTKPEGMIVELADAVIRILDLCHYYGLPLVQALQLKANYNDARPYRHGNKAI